MILGICDSILLLRFSESYFLIVDEFTLPSLSASDIWSLPVLGHPSASMGRVEKKHLEQKATCICSAIWLPIRPVFTALVKETKENADKAPASANESFPWAEWMPSPVQQPGQHQHWVNTETNLCEIKTHFYMVPWHYDRRFLPTKQAQLSCYALWPLLFNERVAKSLNSSGHGEQETKKSGVQASWESRKWAVLPNAKNTGTRSRVAAHPFGASDTLPIKGCSASPTCSIRWVT